MTNLECIEYANKHSFKGLYEKGREDAMNDDGIPAQLVEMGYKKGREEAIDEFLKELYPCRYEYNDDCFLCGSLSHCMVFIAERIADKMKEGKE